MSSDDVSEVDVTKANVNLKNLSALPLAISCVRDCAQPPQLPLLLLGR